MSIDEIGNFPPTSHVLATRGCRGGDMGVHLRGLALLGALLTTLFVYLQFLLG